MNIFNKKTILFLSIATLMINGCVAKKEFKPNSPTKVMFSTNKVQTKNVWKKVMSSKTKKDDCVDCYVPPIDYSRPPSNSNNSFNGIYKQDKLSKTKHYGAYAYKETASDTTVNTNKYLAPAVSSMNSAYSSYGTTYVTNTNTTIQVGAFRQYDGAKNFMKRYNALSHKYKMTIKTGTKNNQPLYRVRIEGFKNKVEAKKFMNRYGIRDAFLVRK